MINKLVGLIRKILSNPTYNQFIKFGFVGVLNTIIFYTIYYIMLRMGFSYVLAVTVGTVVGIVNSYIWSKFFVFKSKKKSIGEVVKFFVVYGVQYLSNLLVIHICITYFGMSTELAGIPAIMVGVFISFLGHKFWSFKE